MSTHAAAPNLEASAVSKAADRWWLPYAILLIAHLPLIAVDLANSWERTHYHFIPFAYAAFFALLWQRQHSYNPKPKLIGSLIAVDLVLLLIASIYWTPWLASVGLWCLLLAACTSRKDEATGGSLFYLAALPAVAVRLPANMDLLVIQQLQTLTSRIASKVLNMLGVLHLRDGNVITLSSKALFVEEACSGVQSLFTLLLLAILICCVKRRRLFHSTVLIISGIFFAILMNVVRVISIALAEDWYQTDLTTGWQHDALGYTVLLAAVGLLYNLDVFLVAFTARVPYGTDSNAEYRNPTIAAFNWLFGTRTSHTPRGLDDPQIAPTSRKIVIACSTLAVAGLTVQLPAMMAVRETFQPTLATGPEILSAESISPEMAGFVRQNYEVELRESGDTNGQFSNVWTYQQGPSVARVSCDHIFCGWHDLSNCYAGVGWEVLDIELATIDSSWTAVKATLSKPDTASFGLLYFSLFTADGQPFEPPPPRQTSGLLQNRLATLRDWAPDTLQCQTFVQQAFPFDRQQDKRLAELHRISRQQIREAVLNNVSSASSETQGAAR
ncbi:MAG: exosortase U [Fuerstiella sp.]